MAKNVALSKDAYEMLDRLKRPGESFSDVVKRLGESKNKPNWREFAGIWKDDEKIGKIFDEILRERHKTGKRHVLKW